MQLILAIGEADVRYFISMRVECLGALRIYVGVHIVYITWPSDVSCD